jgi:putative ATP-dependent endonuclease of the OLD family
LLVFALLTLIADRKGNESVIFAMEEPEIALPPHTQRRVARFEPDTRYVSCGRPALAL